MKTQILILSFLTLAIFSLKAQITKELTDTNVIYHDFIQGVILDQDADTLTIDINEDGVNDIMFHFVLESSDNPYVTVINNSCRISFIYNKYSSDSLLNPLLSWKTGYNYMSFYDNVYRYGVKITDGIDNYYGWINATVTNPEYIHWNINVFQYAFCKIPNYPFLYGQTALTTGVEKSLKIEKTNVFVADSGSSVVVNSDKKIESITITNIAGETLIKQNNVNTNSKKIKTANFAKGTYIVKVQFADGGVFTKKVVL